MSAAAAMVKARFLVAPALDSEAEQCAMICDELSKFPFPASATVGDIRNALSVAALMIRKRKEGRA